MLYFITISVHRRKRFLLLRNLNAKNLRAKLLTTTRGYFMVKFARLDDAFSEILNWKQAQ